MSATEDCIAFLRKQLEHHRDVERQSREIAYDVGGKAAEAWFASYRKHRRAADKIEGLLRHYDREQSLVEPTVIKLTDDFHQDEPLGYLVKNFDTILHEYMVFAYRSQADNHARQQQELSAADGEEEDWLVYPLYAGVQTLTGDECDGKTSTDSRERGAPTRLPPGLSP